MLVLFTMSAFIGVAVWSFWLVMGRINRRARRERVSPTGALILAFFGYLAGTITSVYTAMSLVMAAFDDDPPYAVLDVIPFASSVIGAVVGAGVGYVALWARTAHDPDYEPRDRSRAGANPVRGREA